VVVDPVVVAVVDKDEAVGMDAVAMTEPKDMVLLLNANALETGTLIKVMVTDTDMDNKSDIRILKAVECTHKDTVDVDIHLDVDTDKEAVGILPMLDEDVDTKELVVAVVEHLLEAVDMVEVAVVDKDVVVVAMVEVATKDMAMDSRTTLLLLLWRPMRSREALIPLNHTLLTTLLRLKRTIGWMNISTWKHLMTALKAGAITDY
jgi:hypothetical protein